MRDYDGIHRQPTEALAPTPTETPRGTKAEYKHADPVVQAIRDVMAEHGLYFPCGKPNLKGTNACPCGCTDG